MSIAVRSTRDTHRSIVPATATPASVGPGAYGGDVRGRAAAPAYAGFSSSDARKINTNRGTSAITPGPGAYVKKPALAGASASSNAFRSRARRLAPTAPGSTAFAESSSATTPAPGNYETNTAFRRGLGEGFQGRVGVKLGGSGAPTGAPPGAGAAGIAVVNGGAPPVAGPSGKYNPPTIPRPMQSFGYEDTAGGPRPLEPPADTYTGLGADSVGPAFYQPAVSLTKGSLTGQTKFSQSTERRRVFEPDSTQGNWLPSRHQPGPGYYNPEPSKTVPLGAMRRGEGKQSAPFASRVPMAFANSSVSKQTDVIGPGAYTGLSGRGDSATEAGGLNDAALQCFGSTVDRAGGWARPKECAYTEPTHRLCPGPGAYANPRSMFEVSLQRRLTEEPVGFNSSDARPCMPPGGRGAGGLAALDDGAGGYFGVDASAAVAPRGSATSAPSLPGHARLEAGTYWGPQGPGPGTYNLEPSSLRYGVGKRAAVGRHGVFGTCAARFGTGGLPPEVLKTDLYKGLATPREPRPGPGSYEPKLPEPTAPPPEAVPNPAKPTRPQPPFRSGVDRMGGNARIVSNSRDIGYLVVGKPGAADAGDYQLGDAFDPQHQKRHNRGSGAVSSFVSAQERFSDKRTFDGKLIAETPGPGRYRSQPPRVVPPPPVRHIGDEALFDVVTKMTRDRRFRSDTMPTASDVGPGSYSTGVTMHKKSFNITFSQTKKL